ncbi:PREDICTED: microtubule-associated proteins 1A/1B light chain 3A-like isoform X1 [Polistes canadensis]|uniref:microtubule-associated proteins 1A/1B light chain 3A-like isoform X1 n=1 Tax=Polistes canadensis TaxID=91411 RepID=UPI000718E449|nr:PREDICTED: microtubule-associated proteins 1A/1B light chain 3A-like isoform X1 [Polistes canadensis]
MHTKYIYCYFCKNRNIRKATRVADVETIKKRHPDKIPIVVERFPGEKQLPTLDNTKFLVPDYLSVAELIKILRLKLHLNPTQSFYLLTNSRSLVSGSMTMLQLYQREQDEDGYLYILFASQEVFGH